MLDGLICTAAAAPLEVCRKGALDHCQVAHKSKEPGHSRMMERIGKVGLLDLDMRLGEASGAALAAALVRAAIECHNGIGTGHRMRHNGIAGPLRRPGSGSAAMPRGGLRPERQDPPRVLPGRVSYETGFNEAGF